jgi:hypothetical protein
MKTLESSVCWGLRVGAAEVKLVAPTGLLTGLILMVCFQ